jgi:hypothetical protein
MPGTVAADALGKMGRGHGNGLVITACARMTGRLPGTRRAQIS